jgi:uncharacterized membrane protein
VLGRPATPERLHALAEAGVLDETVLGRALEVACSSPEPSAWKQALDHLLLALGAALLLAGVIFFFAYNWSDLPRAAKLAMPAVGMVIAATAAWQLGFDKLSSKVSLTGASVLLGTWLAVHGQIYQTGADAWEIFAIWAALILPWVAMSCFQPHWALWWALVNLSASTWWDQHIQYSEDGLALLLFSVNGVAWTLRDLPRARALPWMRGRWLPRTLASATFLAVMVPAIMMVLEGGQGHWQRPAGLVALCVAVALTLRRYLGGRRDLYMIAAALGASIAVATTLLGRILLDLMELEEPGILLLAFLVVGQAAAAAKWLRNLHIEEEG